MPLISQSRHNTWKMGELREEFLGQDHTPEFLEGALTLENCDVLEQGIQHRRGGILPVTDSSKYTGVGTHTIGDTEAQFVFVDFKHYGQGNRDAVAMCFRFEYRPTGNPSAVWRSRRVLLVTGEENSGVQKILEQTKMLMDEGLAEGGKWRVGNNLLLHGDNTVPSDDLLTPGVLEQFLVFWGKEGRDDFSAKKFRFEEIGESTWAVLPDTASGMGMGYIKWQGHSNFPRIWFAGYTGLGSLGSINPSEKGYFTDTFEVGTGWEVGPGISGDNNIFLLAKGKTSGVLLESGNFTTKDIGEHITERALTFGAANFVTAGVVRDHRFETGTGDGSAQGDARNRNTRSIWWYVEADIGADTLAVLGPEGIPNYVLVLLTEIIDNTKEVPVANTRYFLAEVLRNKSKAGLSHVLLGFGAAVADPADPDIMAEAGDADHRYMFRSRKTLFNTLKGLKKITTYCLPYFSQANGYSPSSLSMVGGRAIMTTPKNSHVIYSYPGVTRYISAKVPIQFALDEEELRKIREEGADAVAPPSTLEGEEALFYWLFQTGQSRGQIPFADTVAVEDDGVVKWVGGQEGMLVGTSRGEIQVPVDNLIARGLVDYRRFLSKRGTNSSLTARGDESIFFVGPQGTEIFQVDYRQERGGSFSRSSNYHGGDFIREGVVDMKWDFQRKALWVIYGDGKLALYFKQREYAQMAWVKYVFREGFRLLTLIRRDEGGVGFIGNDLNSYECPLPYGKNYTHFQDRYGDGGEVVFDWVSDHICTTGRGSQGEASGYRKRAGEVLLRTAGIGQLLLGGERIPTGAVAGSSRQIFDITGAVVEDDTDFEIPYARVVHKANERGRVLSISRKIEVSER